MVKHNKKLKLNNKGSAIVTVLVVIIFVSILATTVLYLAGRNVRMKATDRHTKESFYQTEQTMEEIKAGLIRIASESYDEAYANMVRNYSSYDASGRKNLFREAFMEAFVNRWELLSDGCRNLATDNAAVDSTPIGRGPDGIDESSRNIGRLRLKDVIVKDRRGDYTTINKTDFLIVCPDVDFELNSMTSVPDSPGEIKEINISDCVMYTNWEKR